MYALTISSETIATRREEGVLEWYCFQMYINNTPYLYHQACPRNFMRVAKDDAEKRSGSYKKWKETCYPHDMRIFHRISQTTRDIPTSDATCFSGSSGAPTKRLDLIHEILQTQLHHGIISVRHADAP